MPPRQPEAAVRMQKDSRRLASPPPMTMVGVVDLHVPGRPPKCGDRLGERLSEGQRRCKLCVEVASNAYAAKEHPTTEGDRRDESGLADRVAGGRCFHLDRKTVAAEHGFGIRDTFRIAAINRMLYQSVQ